MDEFLSGEPLNCVVADNLHKFTGRKGFAGEEEIKGVVDTLTTHAPEQPCKGQSCPDIEMCLKLAELALNLRKINNPPELPKTPDVYVTFELPGNPESV